MRLLVPQCETSACHHEHEIARACVETTHLIITNLSLQAFVCMWLKWDHRCFCMYTGALLIKTWLQDPLFSACMYHSSRLKCKHLYVYAHNNSLQINISLQAPIFNEICFDKVWYGLNLSHLWSAHRLVAKDGPCLSRHSRDHIICNRC
jgi:hypothetical protein